MKFLKLRYDFSFEGEGENVGIPQRKSGEKMNMVEARIQTHVEKNKGDDGDWLNTCER